MSLVNTPENLIIFFQFLLSVKCLNIPLLSISKIFLSISKIFPPSYVKCQANACWMNPRFKVTTLIIYVSVALILSFNRPHCLLTWAELPQFVSENVMDTMWKTFLKSR